MKQRKTIASHNNRVNRPNKKTKQAKEGCKDENR